MIARVVVLATLGAFASAAPAADLRETHVEVRLPPSKGLQPAWRPMAVDCGGKAVAVTPAGKLPAPKAADRAQCADKRS